MMRKLLVQEGKESPNNAIIVVGAIQFDSEHTYPVNGGTSDFPIGVIKNVSREGNELHGDLHWRPDTIPPDENHYVLSVYCTEVKLLTGTRHVIEEATLRGFYVVPAPPAASRSWESHVKV